MATDAEAASGGVDDGGGASGESPDEQIVPGTDEDAPYFVEVWNDYDPSMRFAVIYPVGEKEGARASTVAYYIIEPGKHSGLHSDNVEEVVFVAEGQGEVFVIGATRRLEAGQFVVFPAGTDHDVYAQGSNALRLMSFFPAPEVESTFQQVIYPMGGNVLSSKPPESVGPVVTELDPNNLPEDFPFSLSELGMAEEEAPQELTTTQRLLGMTEPGVLPKDVVVRVIDPKEPDVNKAADQRWGGAEAPADEPAEGESSE
ncbi:MAG TPA: cupin domain-containing protein [Gaiellaceae bacterium]|jgi:quercetin dioxygenase-like cupin family protein|nr:cupin domain-containing protein [Gaiellaceae bacterium]